MCNWIDLRSDTVTLPTKEMYEAIHSAKLGDDIQGDDPTVKKLEREAANLLGFEDALLAISGTMANQIAVMVFTNRGDEVIVLEHSHIYDLEVAGLATLSQVQARPVAVKKGYIDPNEVERLIHLGDIQAAKTSLICLENTYNLNRGQVISIENMREIKEVASRYNIPVYLDGARLFNASVELNVPPAAICEHVDAVQICLTKGLGCPLGSILAGDSEFVEKGRRMRQRLGGGMRQAGIIAAPAIYALEHMIDRLKEDHKKAAYLAKKLSDIRQINVHKVETNIVSFTIVDEQWSAEQLRDELKEKGILVKKIGEKEIRMVTHYNISMEDLDNVIEQFHKRWSMKR